MERQFHFLSHVDDGGLQMYLEKSFDTYSPEFKMFFQIFVSTGGTGWFFEELKAYEQYNFD